MLKRSSYTKGREISKRSWCKEKKYSPPIQPHSNIGLYTHNPWLISNHGKISYITRCVTKVIL
jgi:hypothetical protein